MKVIAILACLLLFAGVVRSLSVQGNRLLDAGGNPILLRGIARPSLEWQPDGQYLSLSDYQLMQGWGANVVRLSLSECFWLQSGTSAAYQSTVAQQVTWITSLGMYVILDLHWSNAGGTASCGQQVMADSDSNTFWSQVAPIYKGNPSVLFELYNEPHDVSWDVWLNGGASGSGWNVVGMQTLYNTVRNAGANNVVIIGGLNFAFDLSGIASHALTGTNIMYNTHPYDYGGKQVSDYQAAFGYLAGSYALIATEFGDYNCDPTYYTNFINYANQYAISYTAWGWFVQGCGFPSLINDWSGTPSASGNVVKNDLLYTSKVPGQTTASAIATVASTATVATNGGGTTGSNGVNLPVYIDGVVNFQDWSWATTKNAQDSTQKHSGSYSYSWSPNNYDALYFYQAGSISATSYQGVEFYVHGGTAGGQQVKFNLIRYDGSNSNKIGPDNLVAAYTSSGTIPAGAWVRGYVDFSAFPSGSYDGFWFQASQGNQQSGMYFDDITLIAVAASTSTTGTTSATTVDATTTTAHASTTLATTTTVAALTHSTTTTTTATATATAATTATTATTAKTATTTTTTATTATTAPTPTTATTVSTPATQTTATDATVTTAATTGASGSTASTTATTAPAAPSTSTSSAVVPLLLTVVMTTLMPLLMLL